MRLGLTQMEVAEAAGLSDRTYADIERGTVNMQVETVLRICKALHSALMRFLRKIILFWCSGKKK